MWEAVTGLCLMTITLLHIGNTVYFWWLARCDRRKSPRPEWTPRARIVLCVKGARSSLEVCVCGLMNQDYPDYTLQIVVDSPEDPAFELCTRLAANSGHRRVEVTYLRQRLVTCAGKLSSLVQALSDVELTDEIVAFADDDIVPPANWLRDLVAPLKDESIGVTTGSRWMTPEGPWGSAAVSVWNVGAICQMASSQMVWGGTMAIRRELIARLRLAEHWSLAFNDDLLLGELVRKAGLKIKFISRLITSRHEEFQYAEFVRWITRQLTHARYYHRHWRIVVAVGFSSAAAMIFAPIVSLVFASQAKWVEASWIAGGWLTYYLTTVGCWYLASNACQLATGVRQSNLAFHRAMLAALLAHIGHGQALWAASRIRIVEWTGRRYRIRGPFEIELIE